MGGASDGGAVSIDLLVSSGQFGDGVVGDAANAVPHIGVACGEFEHAGSVGADGDGWAGLLQGTRLHQGFLDVIILTVVGGGGLTE